jgi:glycosyltransferase involved in cell wall biosynthesis
MMSRGKIRVVHLITALNSGGAEWAMAQLVAGMNRDEFASSVVSLVPGGPVESALREAGTPVTSVSLLGSMQVPGAALRLHRILRRERPHVLQTWLYHADLVGLVIGKVSRVPSIFWNVRCSENVDARGPRGARLMKLLVRLSPLPTGVVVNSRRGQSAHGAAGYRPRAWHLIGNGFDTDVFRPKPEARSAMRAELGIPHDALVVGMVAGYRPIKDHGTFLLAAVRTRELVPNARFVLVGPGIDQSPALARQIEQLGLSRVIHLSGDRRDIPDVLAAFDVATLTSVAEGFPNAIGQAMACGVPTVMTDTGDGAALMGDAGVAVPVRDAIAIAEAWVRILQEPAEVRAARGGRGRARIAECFTVAAAIRRYEDLYRGAVDHSLGAKASTP